MLFTVEVEYVAATDSVIQVLWLKCILDFLQYKQDGLIKILCDNKSTIDLKKNLILREHSKYIDIKFYFICELVQDKEIICELLIFLHNFWRLKYF